MFPLFRKGKGVSEVIASLILILIISVAGAALYAYSMNAFSSSRSSFALQTSGEEEYAQERFSIIAVWWNGANQLNITLLNYGEITLKIDAFYVSSTRVSVYLSGIGQNIVKSGIGSVKFSSPVPIIHGQTYEILSVSQRGSTNAVYWKA